MGRYDSHKFPFHYQMNAWAEKRINTAKEQQPKSIPCHVTKVEKDFITVAFETQNGVFTPPTVKIPQSMSPYGRNPTQVGDKGYAVPGHYYLGGVTGDAGGNTDFYPRGNLTTLSFEHTSHKQNPDRDVDQLTHMGGPNGWTVGSFQKQQQDQGGGSNGGGGGGGGGAAASAATFFRTTSSFRAQQARLRAAMPKDSSGGIGGGIIGGIIGQIPGASQVIGAIGQIQGVLGQLQQAQKDLTQFSFDKNFKALVQSVDEAHSLLVDGQNKNVGLTSSQNIFHNPGKGKVFLGDKDGTGMARVMTEKGPSKNTYAKVG